MKFTVYTDGSGTTGGPAGIAFVAFVVDESTRGDDRERATLHMERSLPLENATNQQAEILAAAYALYTLPEGSEILIWTDSEYLKKGATEWLPRWTKNGWRTSTNGQVKNIGHWKRLDQLLDRHEHVEFGWLRGHDGHEHNERADKLAGEARAMALAAVA